MLEGDFSAAVSVLVDDALFVFFAASGTWGSSYALLRVSHSQLWLTQDRITESTITMRRILLPYPSGTGRTLSSHLAIGLAGDSWTLDIEAGSAL